MAMCPNCGEIVMNGDPYCTHCGTELRWQSDNRDYESRSGLMGTVKSHVPVNMFFSCLSGFGLSANTIDCIKRDFDVLNVRNAFVNVGQEYPGSDLDITFIRQNRYFKTVDSLRYSILFNKIDAHGFRSDFTNLKNTVWFRDAVRRKESATGFEFYDCGGGYDVKWDWEKSKFELKDGCRVIAHFNEDEYHTRGFEVDFKSHGLKNQSERHERANPYDMVRDYDWD